MASIKSAVRVFFINVQTLVLLFRHKSAQLREQCDLKELRAKTDEVRRQAQEIQEFESIISGKEAEMKSQQRGTVHTCLSYTNK